ncbi:unnamed protein product, partial [Mesorhabditis spiculigera]
MAQEILKFGQWKIRLYDQIMDQRTVVEQIADELDAEMSDEGALLCSLDNVIHRLKLWQTKMPRITPFFAVKCHPDPMVIRALSSLGCGFDCASLREIQTILDLQVEPACIIYANPSKHRTFIQYAKTKRVHKMTFDSVEELRKIKEEFEEAELVLRILVSDPTASSVFGRKFGAEPETVARELLEEAKQIGMKVVGISFHVGVGCKDAPIYETAIRYARQLFDYGTRLGHRMRILDIGGGYPGREVDNPQFEKIAAVINAAIDTHFGDVEGSFTLCTKIINAVEVPADRITKNELDSNQRGMMYFLNDGIYGSFMLAATEKIYVEGFPLRPNPSAERLTSIVWGPTCASVDVVEEAIEKERMAEGDWVLYPDMGAYTNGLCTTFNGFPRPTLHYAISRKNWKFLEEHGIQELV